MPSPRWPACAAPDASPSRSSSSATTPPRLEEDELITRVVVPRPTGPATYRKLRTRSQEDRPSSSVAAVVHGDTVRVVVGAVSDRPHHFADVCAEWKPGDLDSARAIGEEYATRIDYIDDNRGTAAYRRHVVGVEVRRALMAVSP